MLVLCSNQSVLRPWVQFESGAAWVRRIPLIPLCHSDMEPQKLPLPFYLLEATRLDDEKGFKLLVSQIERHSGRKQSGVDVPQIAGRLQNLQREWTRRVAINSIKDSIRTAVGSIQLFGTPLLISLIYYIVLSNTQSRDKAGEWFLMSALVFVWPFGLWFRLARPRSQIDAAILAALLIATLAGAGGFLVYRLVSPLNDFQWLFSQYINMITFYISNVLSFLAGRELGKYIETGQLYNKLKAVLALIHQGDGDRW